jgi:ribose transport system ATP-binding protein
MKENNYILEMRNISKSFPGVKALDDVTLCCEKGEVHALVGENGAGKSTMMKILSGVYKPNKGQILIDGKEVNIENPHHAQELGISIIYQEFNLIPYLDVAENIFIGREPLKAGGIIDFEMMYKKSKDLLDQIGIDIDLKKWIVELPVAEQQIIEICKSIAFKAKIVVMDEPSSALSEEETERLFEIIRRLKAQGITVIYISHRLNEIFKIADKVTVIRDGKLVSNNPIKKINQNTLISHMVGRTLDILFPEKGKGSTGKLLEVKQLNRTGVIKDITFEVCKGEIVGLAGLIGSGRTEVARAIFGVDDIDKGEIILNNKRIRIRTPKDAVANGIGLVPEDRKRQGLILCLTVRNNIVLSVLDKIKKVWFTNTKREKEICKEQITKLSIKTPGMEYDVEHLSGGNQQKVVLSKWLAANPQLIIFDEPTRGIDVGAKAEIHRLMRQLANNGAGVLMISSELPEIIGMSDRVYVMCEGEITAEFKGRQLKEETIMKAAVGLCD